MELAAGRDASSDPALPVVDLIAVRHVNDPFGIERLVREWQHDRVGDDVVDEVGSGCSGIAEIARLNWSGTGRENSDPSMTRVTHQIDCNADLQVLD